MSIWLFGLVIGLCGTIAMDLWAIFLSRTFDIAGPNWGNVGRWVRHLARGKVFHDDISQLDGFASEVSTGWIFHYAVGIVYGIVFVAIVGAGWVADPTLIPALVFAWLTICAGWFLLHPGLGLGWALSRTDTPNRGRIMGLIAHTVFGFGLWVSAMIVASLTNGVAL